MPTIEYTVELDTLTCAGCGTPFAVASDLLKKFRRTHETFYCPLGHNNYFPQASEEEKLKKQLQLAEDEARRLRARVSFEHDQREAAERSLRATKGVLTRTKRRVANGVCPCCNRSFANLQRHMAGQHPEYQEEA